jgi:hypothetical protein
MLTAIDGPTARAGTNRAFNTFSIILTTDGLIARKLADAEPLWHSLTDLGQPIAPPSVQLGGEAA